MKVLYRAGFLLCLSVLVPVLATEPCTDSTLVTLDFATKPDGTPLLGGTYLQTEWESVFGLTLTASGGLSRKPRLFNTSDVGSKDFGDFDLGSPNERCTPPGPGSGEGGEPGMPGENCKPLGNVLIIQEDNYHPEQPDDNVNGGTITFNFGQKRKIYEIGLLDVDYEASITVVSKIESGDLTSESIPISLLGDNSVQTVKIDRVNVVQLQLILARSGAVTFLSFCDEESATPTMNPTSMAATSHPSLRPPTPVPPPAPKPTPPPTIASTPPPTPPLTHSPTTSKPTLPPIFDFTLPPSPVLTHPPSSPKPNPPPTPFPTQAECATPTSAPTGSTGGSCVDNSDCETGFCFQAFPPRSPGICTCNPDTNQGCEYAKPCDFAPGTFAKPPSCYIPMGGHCYQSSECLSGNCHKNTCVCSVHLNYPCSDDETCTLTTESGYACRESSVCSEPETCTKPICNPNVGECPFDESPVKCPNGCTYSNPCFADEAGFGRAGCPQDFAKGPTGNLYKAVRNPSGTWNEADENIQALAEKCGVRAHLATITSQEEDEFVHFVGRMSHRYYPAGRGYWVGGYQNFDSPDYQEPGGGWEWVNNEGPIPTSTHPIPSKYSNWGPNEPNNINNGEQYMTVCRFDATPEEDKATGWEDEPPLDLDTLLLRFVHGYIIEVEVEPTVLIEECDTFVENLRLPPLSENCPPRQISSLIGGCFDNHDFIADRDGFVECVAHITNDLKNAGIISDKEKNRIVTCAFKGKNLGCTQEFRQLGGGPEFQEPITGQYTKIVGEAAGDQFGTSVSLSANGPFLLDSYLAVGATRNDGGGEDSGHVRTYEWDGCGQLFFKSHGDIDGESAGDYFGVSVSISDDGKRVATGAYRNGGEDGNQRATGQVRVTTFSGRQLGDALYGDSLDGYFGYSVSLSSTGSIMAVGAPLGRAAGYVRVFEWNGIMWTKMGDDIGGTENDFDAGRSVSLSSDGLSLALGGFGYAEVYEFKNNSWRRLGGRLYGTRLENRINYGWSVSLAPDGLVMTVGAVGDIYDTNPVPDEKGGEAYIYRWNGDSWLLIGDKISGEVSDEFFGLSVSVSARNAVAIGGIGKNNDTGHVALYNWNGFAWEQIEDFDGESEGDYSGYSVSLSSDGAAVAIGAPGGESDGRGHVRVFSCK